MKNMKEFCKENKDKIIFTGCMIGSAVIGALIYKQLNTKEVIDPYRGKSVISWVPGNRFMNLEKAKKTLDLNGGNHESFALVKEGVNPDEYSCIVFSDHVIMDKPEEA